MKESDGFEQLYRERTQELEEQIDGYSRPLSVDKSLMEADPHYAGMVEKSRKFLLEADERLDSEEMVLERAVMKAEIQQRLDAYVQKAAERQAASPDMDALDAEILDEYAVPASDNPPEHHIGKGR